MNPYNNNNNNNNNNNHNAQSIMDHALKACVGGPGHSYVNLVHCVAVATDGADVGVGVAWALVVFMEMRLLLMVLTWVLS